VRGFLDTEPLQKFLMRVLPNRDGVLIGIAENIARGRLNAAAVTATSYSTGQTVVFAQGQDIETWRRPQRRAEQSLLTVRHIMASAALPMFFPAIRVGDEWFGDGGMRLTAPLSPALHLGAGGILAISTRYDRTANEAETPQHVGYPPPAQVLGSLLNAVFLDLIDQDALRLQLINGLIERMPADQGIIEQMENNLEDPLSPSLLARQAGLSTRQLERLFRRYLERSPKRYYLELRLNKARSLLLQTEMSVINVALACGFSSPSHFSKCYRAFYGRTPYRERGIPGLEPARGRGAAIPA
jgi:NTE family protein